ncbi:MAG: PHP domain-containing protein [Candidatus Heimdallarchaeota archaeon]|nr:MAG: PHP domain-containing protein [Candidatus Heimdallarchaeota archaeon]
MARVDFHCHTKYSKCSNLEPKQILKLCKKQGLQGIMICDHNTIKGALAFKEVLSPEEDFIFIPGIEILTDRGEVIGSWIEEDLKTSHFPEVAEEIKERGGMVVIPHPFDAIRGKRFRVSETDLPYIDAIEIFNSRCILPRANKRALKLAEKYSLIQTAGSDAHFSPELGNAWIDFIGSTTDEFRQSLQKGEISTDGRRSPFSVHLHTIHHRMKRTFRRNQK